MQRQNLLQAAASSVAAIALKTFPDNAPYAVDNRVRPAHPDGQLTKAGFGFELANGWFENPFLATRELPEPLTAALLLSGLLAIGAVRSMNLKNVESGCVGVPISAEC